MEINFSGNKTIEIVITASSVVNLLKRTFKMSAVHNDRACTWLFPEEEPLIRTADVHAADRSEAARPPHVPHLCPAPLI